MTFIYKIVPAQAWDAAVAAGAFTGAAIDVADGYIHLSDAAQVEETARRHFAEQVGLLLVAFRPEQFGAALRWEPSRGGALFPHLYGAIDPAAAVWVKPLPWQNSAHVFPAGWRA